MLNKAMVFVPDLSANSVGHSDDSDYPFRCGLDIAVLFFPGTNLS